MQAQQQYYKALSGLRGVGAIWVTLFHIFSQSSSQLISAGYLGVDLFFILSGFIISHVHYDDFSGGYHAIRHWRFLQLRLIRIYPLHVFVLLLFFIFVVTAPNFVQLYSNPERFSLSSLVATLLLVQNWGIVPPNYWNGPTWSLSAEWLAYLVFPFISIGVAKVKVSYLLIMALLALAVLEIFIFAAGVQHDQLGKVGLLRLAFEFTSGCFLYQYSRAGNCLNIKFPAWGAIALLLAAIYVPALKIFAVTSFLFVILAVVSEKNLITYFLSSRLLLFLGDISFSLYLCHWPLIQLRNWAIKQKYVEEKFSLYLLVLAIFLITVLCWKFVEMPARKFGRRILSKNELHSTKTQAA